MKILIVNGFLLYTIRMGCHSSGGQMWLLIVEAWVPS